MLQNLDITDDDGGLPTSNATNGEDNSQNIENGSQIGSEKSLQNSSNHFANSQQSLNQQRPRVRQEREKFLMPSKYNHRIYRAYIRGKFEQAKVIIESLLAKGGEPVCEYALLIRALIAREEGQVRESMEWLTKAISYNPCSLRLIYEIGKTHMLLGEHEKAGACFEKCMELDSNDWKYYYWKAATLCHKKAKKQTDAINEAQECLLHCPRLNKCVNMLMFVAKTCIQKNDFPPAIEAYRIAQELEPENLEVISHLGLLYLKAGNEEKAFSCLGKALTYDPNHMPSIIAAASVLQMNGDFDVALSKYRVAASSCDHNGTLWNNIGLCFLGKGKLVASISCLKRANYLCSLDWKILFNLAIVHCAMMQYASAYNFMSSALNLNPKNRMLLMGLAIILTELNDHVNSRKAYKRALQMDQEDFIVRLNFAVFEYRHGTVEDCMKILQNVKAPRNIDQVQFSDVKLLAERLRVSLRKLNEQ